MYFPSENKEKWYNPVGKVLFGKFSHGLGHSVPRLLGCKGTLPTRKNYKEKNASVWSMKPRPCLHAVHVNIIGGIWRITMKWNKLASQLTFNTKDIEQKTMQGPHWFILKLQRNCLILRNNIISKIYLTKQGTFSSRICPGYICDIIVAKINNGRLDDSQWNGSEVRHIFVEWVSWQSAK